MAEPPKLPAKLPAKFDDSAKQRVKDALKAHGEAQLEASGQAVSSERSAAELDPEAPYSSDDLSQSDAAGELHGLLESAHERQLADLAAVDRLDFGVKDVVEPGAIVAFGGDHYVVGVVADAFECDGVAYEGISTESPVFHAIAGLRAGDTFTFNGHEHRLDLVC